MTNITDERSDAANGKKPEYMAKKDIITKIILDQIHIKK